MRDRPAWAIKLHGSWTKPEPSTHSPSRAPSLSPTYTQSSPKSLFCRLYSLRAALLRARLRFPAGSSISTLVRILRPGPIAACHFFLLSTPGHLRQLPSPCVLSRLTSPFWPHRAPSIFDQARLDLLQLPAAALVSHIRTPVVPRARSARVGYGHDAPISTDYPPWPFDSPRLFGKPPVAATSVPRSVVCWSRQIQHHYTYLSIPSLDEPASSSLAHKEALSR